MKIIFLDIDGVLNSDKLIHDRDEAHRSFGHHGMCECYRLEHMIDREAVRRLNVLIAWTGAKIVISSSWRKLLDPPELARVLAGHGLVGEIIGETPDGPNDPSFAYLGPHDRISRGHEIDHWLKAHPEVERYVILDDCSDMEMHTYRLVHTDPLVGFVDRDLDIAVAMMTWNGREIPPP